MSDKHDEKIDSKSFGKVAVLMGGHAAEQDISRATGAAVLASLLGQGVDAVAVDAADDLVKSLGGGSYDRVFVAMHGRGGEDGLVQGFLETLGLPYTGSGVMASSLAMDKCRSKQVWQSMGLPTPEFMEIGTAFDAENVVATLGLPLVVKPVREGSSYGISKVVALDELAAARELALRYDSYVMAEQWVSGGEYTAAIVDGRALPLIKLETPRTFYDYEAKYTENTTQYLCPCGLDAATEQELLDLSLQAFNALGASGWGRVDFMLDEAGSPSLIELNTVPGLTDHSLVPMAAKAAGMDFDKLILKILASSLT